MRRSTLAFVPALLAFLACAGTPAPEPKPPQQPTYDPRPQDPGGGSLRPLVVDWNERTRGDLEVSMREGIAVVSYRGGPLKLLGNCHIEGSYGYVSMTPKASVLRLESEEEVSANLQATGQAVMQKLGPDFKSGAVVDVALMSVGKFRTTRAGATKAQLVGDCAAATHLVRGAIVGAFAIGKGDKAKPMAAEQLIDAKAASVCQSAQEGTRGPPRQCGELLRLELTELTSDAPKGGADAAKSARAAPKSSSLPDAQDDAHACPPGLVLIEGKCSGAKAGAAFECTGEQAAPCAVQCTAGNMASCTKFAQLSLFGARGAETDVRGAAKLLAKACTEGHEAHACAVLGSVLSDPQFTDAPDFPIALKLFQAACDAGDDSGCMNLAQAHLFARGTPRDPATAAKFYAKACGAGNKDGCSAVGVLLQGGNGIAKDLVKSLEFLKMACIGDSAEGCENLGYMVEVGLGTATNPKLAADIYKKACELSDNHCGGLATAKQLGMGTAKDDAESVALYRKACATEDVSACAFLRAYVDPKVKFNEASAKDQIPIWKGLCQSGNERSCTSLAVLLVALGDKDGQTWMQGACKKGDAWACSNKSLQVKAK
jgi:TPR repeat protein